MNLVLFILEDAFVSIPFFIKIYELFLDKE